MALSIGATMATFADVGDAVTDLIVFGAEPSGVSLHAFAQHHHDAWGFSTAEVITARKAEEARAVDLLGASTANLDFFDAIYRSDFYTSDAALFGTPSLEEAQLPSRIASAADDLVRTLNGSGSVDDVRFYAPLAIGHHVDHQLCFEAGRVLSGKGYVVTYYEDLPYAMIGDNLDRRRSVLENQGLHMTIVASHPTAIGWDRKIAAVMAYPSQLETVFRNYAAVEPTAPAIADALSTYHTSVGNGVAVERFWAIDDV